MAAGSGNSLGRRVEYLFLLLLLAGFVWRGLIPGWRSLNTDFSNYYLATRLYRQGCPLKRAYDWVWFQRQKDHAGVDQPLVSFIPNPPSCILPFLPLASVSPLAAKRWWLVINLALLGGIVVLLNAIVQMGLRRVAIIVFLPWTLCVLISYSGRNISSWLFSSPLRPSSILEARRRPQVRHWLSVRRSRFIRRFFFSIFCVRSSGERLLVCCLLAGPGLAVARALRIRNPALLHGESPTVIGGRNH